MTTVTPILIPSPGMGMTANIGLSAFIVSKRCQKKNMTGVKDMDGALSVVITVEIINTIQHGAAMGINTTMNVFVAIKKMRNSMTGVTWTEDVPFAVTSVYIAGLRKVSAWNAGYFWAESMTTSTAMHGAVMRPNTGMNASAVIEQTQRNMSGKTVSAWTADMSVNM